MHSATRGTRAWVRSVTAMAVAVLVSCVLLLLTTTPVEAHENALSSSEPPASATVAQPPQRVVLNFRWRIRPESAMVTVVGPDGATQWQDGKVDVTDRSIGVVLRPLVPAGRYEVRYQALSGSGRPFQGAVEFTLAQPVPAEATAAGTGGSGLPLAWIAGVALLTAAASIVGVRLGRTLP